MSHTLATRHYALTADLAPAIRRAKADFLEMPGLRLTAAEGTRLWGLELPECEIVLRRLVEMGFLVRTNRATFSRA